MQAIVIRMAHHADKNNWKAFMKSLGSEKQDVIIDMTKIKIPVKG